MIVGGDNLKGVGADLFTRLVIRQVALFENVKGYIVTRESKGISSAKQICDVP